MTRMLKTALPTIVPIPTSPFATNTPKNFVRNHKISQKDRKGVGNQPITEVNSSGADEPAAMKVAPATSSDNWSFLKHRLN